MKLDEWLLNVSDALVNNPTMLNIVTSIIILLIGFVIGRIIGRIILKFLKEIEFNKNISKAIGHKTSLANTISNWISYLIYFITTVMALENIGLAPFFLNVVLTVIVLVVGVSILLAVKDFLPNFIAGYSVRKKEVFKVGSRVQVGEISGKIIKMNLLDTHVETRKKDLMVLPNSYFLKNLVMKQQKSKKQSFLGAQNSNNFEQSEISKSMKNEVFRDTKSKTLMSQNSKRVLKKKKK